MTHKLQITENIDGWFFLRVESKRLDDYIELFNSSDTNVIGIAISSFYGFKETTLKFVKQLKKLKALYIQDPIADISDIYELSNLEWLLLPEKKMHINFEFWPNLKTLRAFWSGHFTNLNSSNNLKLLSLSKYKSESLVKLGLPQNLEKLDLVSSSIASLDGIQAVKSLEELELSYMRNLNDISLVLHHKKSLKKLSFDHCKNILEFNYIEKLKSLKKLSIDDCGEIKSINFISKLLNLEFLSIVNTNILDGDMSHCLNLKKLRHVGFFDKRHYSHKSSELKSILGR